MKTAYCYKALDIIVKDVDRKTRVISGYFSAFNVKDSDDDIIRPGAYQKSISENGPDSSRPRIKHLMNHNPSLPLGKVMELKEDDFGLLYRSQIGTHNLGNDFLKMVDSGLITEHSIGYNVIKSEKDLVDHSATILTEVKLWEGSSLSGWGANQFTPLVAAKGMSIDVVGIRIKEIEKFIKTSDATEETIDLLFLQIKQLQQYVQDLIAKNDSTQPEVKSTEPDKDEALLDAVHSIRSLFKPD